MNKLADPNNIIVKQLTSFYYQYNSRPSVCNRCRQAETGMIFVIEGHATLSFDKKTITLSKGDGIFIPTNRQYLYTRRKAGKILVINFIEDENTAISEFIKFHIPDIKGFISHIDNFKTYIFMIQQTSELV